MSVGQIAVRYAKALFRGAREKGVLDPVRENMEMLIESVTGIPDLVRLIESPTVDSGQKGRALTEIFSGSFNELSLDFLRLVTANRREEYLPGMAHYYIKLYKKEKGIQVATISSAVGLAQESKEEIRKMIKEAFKSEIELEEEIKSDLIGGFIIRVEDRQLDSSVKGKLARIKKELRES
jgi:F-type H+-transporting ATPase subunit delta